MADKDQTVALPLIPAYTFGLEHGLEDETNAIKSMKFAWEYSYTSFVRRGYIIALFEKNEIFEEFKEKFWPIGNTTKGETLRRRYLRIKQRYDDFLEDQGLGSEESDEAEEAEETIEQQFAAEDDLRDFLAQNPSCIEPGLHLYQSDKSAVEFPIDGGRIDLLGVDKNQRLVVIELKLGKGRNKVLGQILYYMGWVDKNLGKGPCRGIIIAKEIPDALALAVHRVPGIALYRYSLSVAVELVAP